jgi:V8-like Glu-specific endopeptidase
VTIEVVSPADQLLFTTIRLETEYADGHGSGTAFFYQFKTENGAYPFVVTNKHVVDGAFNGQMAFTIADGDQPLIGQKFSVGLPQFDSYWFGHQDPEVDIAILPLAPIIEPLGSLGKKVYTKYIGAELIPSASLTEELDAIEEITFVGYPNGLYDTVNLTPLIRRGITATPLRYDYCGEKAFLIDASVFPGSSGSPVFLFNQGSYPARSGEIVIGSRLHFLGILSSVLVQLDEGKFEVTEIPTRSKPRVTIEQLIDLGYVFKADLVQEAVVQLLRKEGEIA